MQLWETIFVGRNVFVNHDTLFMDDAPITLGDDVLIGPHSQLITAWHPVEDHERRRSRRLWERCEPIVIGENNWLAAGVIVLLA
jgi:maltose O-acetyltransferase